MSSSALTMLTQRSAAGTERIRRSNSGCWPRWWREPVRPPASSGPKEPAAFRTPNVGGSPLHASPAHLVFDLQAWYGTNLSQVLRSHGLHIAVDEPVLPRDRQVLFGIGKVTGP